MFLNDRYTGQIFVVKKECKIFVECETIDIIIATDDNVLILNMLNGTVTYKGKLIAAFGTAVNTHRYAEFTSHRNICFTSSYREEFERIICSAEAFNHFDDDSLAQNCDLTIIGPGNCSAYYKGFNILAKDAIFDFTYVSPSDALILANQKIKIRRIFQSSKKLILALDHQCEFI